MKSKPCELELPDSVPFKIRAQFSSLVMIHDRAVVAAAIDRLAVRLTIALQDRNPVVVTVMNGGLMLAGLLQYRLAFAAEFGYVSVGRYGTHTAGGALTWKGFDVPDLDGRTVVFVDDILDQGETLKELVRWAEARGASDVRTAVLVERTDEQRSSVVHADFSAFKQGPGFLVGCGMDLAGYGRNLPDIYMIPEQVDG